MYQFALLDPRSTPEAQAHNDAIFANSHGVLGIEVTIPALAERCSLGNIDPQHSEHKDQAAIEVVLSCPIPPDGANLVTLRADLDSLGAMAVLEMRDREREEELWCEEQGFSPGPSLHLWRKEVQERIRLISESDRAARGPWPGPRPLPTRDDPWGFRVDNLPSDRPSLSVVGAMVVEHGAPLADRVLLLSRWLETGDDSFLSGYAERVERERGDLIRAIESGEIRATAYCLSCVDLGDERLICQDHHPVAVVHSTHRAATEVGYRLAPVVIAENPAFRFQGGELHRKITICQYQEGHVDLRAVLAELRELEPGWGGSPAIVGSPQGVGCSLPIETIIGIVLRHLHPDKAASSAA